MNPADKRLIDLIDKWLASLELHLKYSGLDDESYWKVQPWVKHDRPSRWIIELARQKAQQLKDQLEVRIAMGDAKFGDSLELMGFLSNLVGSQHIERFIPLAEAHTEVDLAARAPVARPAAASATPPGDEATQSSAVRTQPRKTISDTTREMARPPADAPPSRHASEQRAEARKGAARREPRAATAVAPKPRAEARATSAEREQAVVADAVRLLGWGRKWHELADLISRMANRPAVSEVRRILRDNKVAIDQELDREG